MHLQTKTPPKNFNKKYSIAIETVLLPENLEQSVRLLIVRIMRVINQIITDAATVAVGIGSIQKKPRKSSSIERSLLFL